MKKIAIYPGTFDPLTLGHQDLIQRAAKLFDQVIVGVADNISKKTYLSLSERVDAAQQVLVKFSNVEVCSFQGLVVDFVRSRKASVIIRGLRAATDFEFEVQLANMNRKLAPEIETFFLAASGNYACISSTLVREIATLKGDVSLFVDPIVAQVLISKIKK